MPTTQSTALKSPPQPPLHIAAAAAAAAARPGPLPRSRYRTHRDSTAHRPQLLCRVKGHSRHCCYHGRRYRYRNPGRERAETRFKISSMWKRGKRGRSRPRGHCNCECRKLVCWCSLRSGNQFCVVKTAPKNMRCRAACFSRLSQPPPSPAPVWLSRMRNSVHKTTSTAMVDAWEHCDTAKACVYFGDRRQTQQNPDRL